LTRRRSFDDPIDLSDGRQPITLQDAGITKFPKAKHSAPVWQVAMEALMIAARRGADIQLNERVSLRQSATAVGLSVPNIAPIPASHSEASGRTNSARRPCYKASENE
jgi:hypothetical protein